MKNSIPSSVARELQAMTENKCHQQPAKNQISLQNMVIGAFILATIITVTVWAIVSPCSSY